MTILKVLNGPESGREIKVAAAENKLGREEECDIQLLENSISRCHAVLEQREGQWFLRDLKSQNGCFVEDKRITEEQLNDGARLRLGNLRLRFFIGTDSAQSTGGEESSQYDDSSVASKERKKQRIVFSSISAVSSRGSELSQTAGRFGNNAESGIVRRIKESGSVQERITAEFGKVIVGQQGVLEQILIAIAAQGHALMIGLPGLAKTLMVSTLAEILRLQFKRVQFTPDLMPSDILGTEVLDMDSSSNEKSFRFIQGPIFANMILADEINRTPPKTQAALLESMQERQVTVANQTYSLPSPFFVLATQNPLEQEGTYPLPEAQLDRFMLNITVDYPEPNEEEEIVSRTTMAPPGPAAPMLTADDILQLQEAVRALPVSAHIIKYATGLVRATRPGDSSALPFVKEYVFCGAGPRAAQNLVLGAKARAAINGRINVSCADIRALALPVMRHRIFTNFTADSEGVASDDLIDRVVESVLEPDGMDQDY